MRREHAIFAEHGVFFDNGIRPDADIFAPSFAEGWRMAVGRIKLRMFLIGLI